MRRDRRVSAQRVLPYQAAGQKQIDVGAGLPTGQPRAGRGSQFEHRDAFGAGLAVGHGQGNPGPPETSDVSKLSRVCKRGPAATGWAHALSALLTVNNEPEEFSGPGGVTVVTVGLKAVCLLPAIGSELLTIIASVMGRCAGGNSCRYPLIKGCA